MKKSITLLIYLILFILLAIFIKNNYDEFISIPKISIFYFSLMLIISFIGLYNNGLRIKLFADYYNINLKPKEWFGLASITTMGNYLTPMRGGVAARAIYLKKIHNFSYTSFLTTMTASYIIRFFMYGLLGIIFSILSLLYFKIFNIWVFLFFIGLFLSTLFLILYSPVLSNKDNKFLNWIVKILNDWKLLSKDFKLLFKLAMFELIFVITMGLRLFFAYRAFDLFIPISVVFIISIFSTISIFLSITPAGLGVTELIITLSSTFLGLALKEGVYVALLDRLSSVIIAFSFGIVFSYILMRSH